MGICRFLSLCDRLYVIRSVRLATMTGLITDDLASNQSWVFEVIFPKVPRAVRCMVWLVSRRMSHFSVAESLDCGAPNSLSKGYANCDMMFGCDILLTSVRGFPCFLVRWNSLVAAWYCNRPMTGLCCNRHCVQRASINHGRNMDDPWINVLYYRLCVSRRIDTWQIVYLLYEDACPIISIHKNEI